MLEAWAKDKRSYFEGAELGNATFGTKSFSVTPRALLDRLNNRSSVLQSKASVDSWIVEEITESLRENNYPFTWSIQEDEYCEYLDDDQLLDYLVYRFKFREFPSRKIVSDFPVYALVEMVSNCNLKCVMCYHSDQTFRKKPYMGYMDPALFKEVLGELEAGGCRAVTFAARGEPLLHPDFESLIGIPSDRFFEVKLNTNLLALNESKARAIMESNVTHVVFSIDTEDPLLYASIRKGGDFEKLMEKLHLFNRIKSEYIDGRKRKLQTRVQGMFFHPAQNPDAFKKFFGELVDEVGLAFVRNQWDTYGNEISDTDTPCSILWNKIYVWWDGIINPCELDYKSKLSVGTYSKGCLKDLWVSPESPLGKLRSEHLNGARKRYVPCDRCGVHD